MTLKRIADVAEPPSLLHELANGKQAGVPAKAGIHVAGVAELVDALGLGPSAARLRGSSPLTRTTLRLRLRAASPAECRS